MLYNDQQDDDWRPKRRFKTVRTYAWITDFNADSNEYLFQVIFKFLPAERSYIFILDV